MISNRHRLNTSTILWAAGAILFTLIFQGLFSSYGDAQEKKYEDFGASQFTNSTQIDNKWMPMRPGTRYTYDGTTIEDDGTAVPHRAVFTVTDLIKVIGGVRTVVCWELDYSEGELEETEIVFLAQDNDGNVWHLGQYPEEYDDGNLVETPAWIHGVENAIAGIMMKAKPQQGTPSYSQGWGPAVEYTDRGRVHQMGQVTTVPAGSYKDVLVIAESSASEPDAEQLKYYASGVGNVRVGWRGAGEKTKETLELTKIEHLDPADMAEVRAEVLKLEKRAYEASKNVYAQTPPMEDVSGTVLKNDKPETLNQALSKTSKISENEAVAIALKAVPGEVTEVAIEKKHGANRYVVEVLSKEDGSETDVIIDMETGKVLATEK